MRQTNQEEETTGERENHNPITITRRDAVIAAAIGGMGQAGLFAGTFTNVEGQQQNLEVQVGEFSDGATVYRQYADGDVTEFTLGDNTEMSIEYDSMPDEYIHCEVGFAKGNGSYETVGDARVTTQENGGTITMTANDLWGGGSVDLVDDMDVVADYDEISVGSPSSMNDPVHVDTDFRLRFRFVSTNATLTEQEVLEFTLSACVPLGFGQSFGKNFGENYPEHWPKNWDSA
jgi:hypothetical protein